MGVEGCDRCGLCCAEFFLTQKELEEIQTRISQYSPTQVFKNLYYQIGECPLKDNSKNECTVYDIRPLMCRSFFCIEMLPDLTSKEMQESLKRVEAENSEWAKQMGHGDYFLIFITIKSKGQLLSRV